MKARRQHFSYDRPWRLIGGLSGCAVIGGLLAGCVGDPVRSARINPASPIAAEATQMVRSNRHWPSFSQIPPAPTDVRAPQAFGVAASDIQSAGERLEKETGPDSWSLTGTDRFAARANAQASDDSVESRDTDAFARSARERATPPPPPR